MESPEIPSEKKENVNIVPKDDMESVVGTKKMFIVSSLICAGIALLLWVIVRTPTESSKQNRGKTCRKNETTCPEEWAKIENGCFFPSEDQQFWDDGQEICEIHGSSLAIFYTRNQLEAMMYVLGSSSYWIGLRKYSGNKYWTWKSGQIFDDWFTIKGNGKCVFIYEDGVGSDECNDLKHYICSQNSTCP